MAGRGLQRQATAHAVLARHELRLLRLDDGQHRIVVGVDLEGLGAGPLGLGLPEVMVGARHHVLGVGKGRHPLAVLQPRVPADMVDVQMGAHHEVDLLGLDARLAQTLEILGVQHVEARHARPRLVVAAAGIDQDRVLARAQQPGMDRGHQPAALRLVVARRQPMAFGREGVGVELGKEILGREARTHLFFDARHAHVADVTVLHFRFLLQQPNTTSTRRLEISGVPGAVTTSGLELPRLAVTMRCCGTPSSTRYLATASARRWATSWLIGLGADLVRMASDADLGLRIGLQRRLDRRRGVA